MGDNMPENQMLTKNFSKAEVSCRCCGKTEMQPEFMAVLQKLRDIVKFPLVITSGYRCIKHNKKVGGALTSKHLQGRAVDIDTTGLTAHQRKTLIEAIKIIPELKGVGIASSFIHIDNREYEAEWTY
jgi:uncharacterized protein YcbK (DUF882 family)